MKLSNYNMFIRIDKSGNYAGYNCFSGGMYIFNKEQYAIVKQIIASPKQELEKRTEPIREKLKKGRFIIPNDFDELQMLKLKSNISRYNPNGLAMVIAPTLDCNFDCPYCYVDRGKVSMNRNTISRLKKFFRQRIKKTDWSAVSWTGGEPLLALDTIEELNLFFKNEASRSKAKYDCSMITNGYLLTEQNIQRLKKSGISQLQITIDGSKEYHDHYRFTKGGKGTYQRVVENVVLASRMGMKIALRSNIDRENYDGVYKLIDDLIDRDINRENIIFAPCMVMDVEMGQGISCGQCFSKKEFSVLEPKILSYAIKKGFKLYKKVLATHSTFCGANTMSLFVFDSHANVLKCWCNLGNADNNKIGYIAKSGNVTFTDNQVLCRWMSWDPFEIEECLKCEILPVCMGGCMYYHIMKKTDSLETACSLRKYNLKEIIKVYYQSAMNESKSTNTGPKKEKECQKT